MDAMEGSTYQLVNRNTVYGMLSRLGLFVYQRVSIQAELKRANFSQPYLPSGFSGLSNPSRGRRPGRTGLRNGLFRILKDEGAGSLYIQRPRRCSRSFGIGSRDA